MSEPWGLAAEDVAGAAETPLIAVPPAARDAGVRCGPTHMSCIASFHVLMLCRKYRSTSNFVMKKDGFCKNKKKIFLAEQDLQGHCPHTCQSPICTHLSTRPCGGVRPAPAAWAPPLRSYEEPAAGPRRAEGTGRRACSGHWHAPSLGVYVYRQTHVPAALYALTVQTLRVPPGLAAQPGGTAGPRALRPALEGAASVRAGAAQRAFRSRRQVLAPLPRPRPPAAPPLFISASASPHRVRSFSAHIVTLLVGTR